MSKSVERIKEIGNNEYGMNRHGAVVNRTDTNSENPQYNQQDLSHNTDESISSCCGSSISGNGDNNPLERKNTANFGGIEEEEEEQKNQILSD